MKKIALLAATIGSALFLAGPSSAQPQIQIGIGADGRPQIGIRDPERERWERRQYWRRRAAAERAAAYEAGRRDAWTQQQVYRSYSSRCRYVTIQEEDEWGNATTRRMRRCG